MPANLENSAVATGLEKVSFHFSPMKGNGKECSNYRTSALTSHASKVMLKILQARLQQYMNHELSDVQTGCKRQRNQRSNCQHLLDHQKSKRVPEKHQFLLYWLCQNLCVDHNKLWKILKEMRIPDHLNPSWETCMQFKRQHLEPYMEKWTGSKVRKEYIKDVYCHPAYLISMQSTSCQMLGCIKHKLESRLLGEISITSDMQMTPPLWQKAKKN